MRMIDTERMHYARQFTIDTYTINVSTRYASLHPVTKLRVTWHVRSEQLAYLLRERKPRRNICLTRAFDPQRHQYSPPLHRLRQRQPSGQGPGGPAAAVVGFVRTTCPDPSAGYACWAGAGRPSAITPCRHADIVLPSCHGQDEASTVYFDPNLHKVLRLKSAQTEQSVSDLINEAVRLSLAEDAADLEAFEAIRGQGT